MKWSQLSARAPRVQLPIILIQAAVERQLSQLELRRGFIDSWVSCEWPTRIIDADCWSMILAEIVEPGCFIDDRAEPDLVTPTETLPQAMTLYRGSVRGRERGYSWTANRDRAIWFATRFPYLGQQVLSTVEVPRELVVARIFGRGEEEFVLSPHEGELDNLKIHSAVLGDQDSPATI